MPTGGFRASRIPVLLILDMKYIAATALVGTVAIDGTDAASEANATLEEDKFKVAEMPYYALLDPDEHVVAVFADRTTDPQEFLAFLKKRPGA